MVHFVVRCDPVPGRQDELDTFLDGKSREFWTSQEGIRAYRVYEDALVGWAERTIMIEADSLASLERVLQSEERKRQRHEFQSLATDIQSQILEERY